MPSWASERSDVADHFPGFFFRQDKRNKRGHGGSLAAVLQDPEKFAVCPSRLPLSVREVSRQWSPEIVRIDVRPEAFAVDAVTGATKCLRISRD